MCAVFVLACKVSVHTTCMKQLYYEGIFCKPTFREIKQKAKSVSFPSFVCVYIYISLSCILSSVILLLVVIYIMQVSCLVIK